MPIAHRKLCNIFAISAVLMLFGSHPLAVLPPGFADLPFHVHLPGSSILSLLALPVIISGCRRLPRWLLWLVLLFLASLAVNAVRFPHQWLAGLALAGHVLIPWAVAHTVAAGTIDLRRAAGVGAWLWGIQAAYALVSWIFSSETVGFSGNRNWFASAILALAPWAWLHLQRATQRRRHQVLLGAGIALITLVLLIWCRSRGAFLAVGVYVVVITLLRLRWRERLLFSALLLLAGLLVGGVAITHFPQQTMRTLRADVRLPMWFHTVRMIADHPLGIGPGNFTKSFAPYRARSTYHERLVAAPVTLHPHNEVLNVAAQIGVIAGLVWLLLWLPLCARPQDHDALWNGAMFAAFIIGFHSLLDMTLVQPPGDLLALVALGICWSASLGPAQVWSEKSPQYQIMRACTSAAVILALLGVPWLVRRDVQLDLLFRKAYICERDNDFEQTFSCYQRAAELTPDDVRAQMFAGIVALDRLQDPIKALPYLRRASAIDPNYGHLNSKLGKTLALLGQQAQALHFFTRECQLYPAGVAPLQRYLTSLTLTGCFDGLPPAYARLRAIYRQRTVQRHLQAENLELIQRFYAAIDADESEAAGAAAGQLTADTPLVFIDPLFHSLTVGKPWPPGYLYESFNYGDFHYWRTLELVQRFVTLTAPEGDTETRLRQLSAALRLIPEAPAFAFPDVVLEAGGGSALSCFTILSLAAQQLELSAVLDSPVDGTPTSLVVSDGVRAWRIDLAATALQVGPAADPSEVWPPLDRLQMVFLPQAFLLKNFALGAIIRDQAPALRPVFDVFPTLLLWQAMTQADPPAAMTLKTFSQHCRREPVDALRARLEAIFGAAEAAP